VAESETLVVTLTCDLCGKEHGVETYVVDFGSGYELDLCSTDLKKLDKAQDALMDLLAHGRKVGGGRRRSTGASRTGKRSSAGTDPGAVREWARKEGYEVSDRGRIPTALVEAFEAAK
jgi:Lsr2